MKEICSTEELNSRIRRVLVSKEEIDAAIKTAGAKIDSLYDGKPILLVSILKGAFVFLADLCRAVTVPCEIAFMCAKSYYEGTVSTGVVKIVKDLQDDLSGKDVIVVEDILDSGRTLSYLKKHIEAKGANSISIVTLLDKPDRRVVDVYPNYTGFNVPDEFVVGYGLDYDGYGRNLRDIYTLINEE